MAIRICFFLPSVDAIDLLLDLRIETCGGMEMFMTDSVDLNFASLEDPTENLGLAVEAVAVEVLAILLVWSTACPIELH